MLSDVFAPFSLVNNKCDKSRSVFTTNRLLHAVISTAGDRDFLLQWTKTQFAIGPLDRASPVAVMRNTSRTLWMNPRKKLEMPGTENFSIDTSHMLIGVEKLNYCIMPNDFF